jgi:hypothetical protein
VERIGIIGAGQAGLLAAMSLRQDGFAGSITLIGGEEGLPYQRPPLSKAYLKTGDWSAPTHHEFPQEPLGRLGVSERLHDDFERVSIAIDRAPDPVLLPADRDHNFVQVPLVGGPMAITSDLCIKLRSKFRQPISDRFMVNRDAAFCQ